MQVSKKKMRKELWDYLKAEGIEITATQHNEIRRIIESYIDYGVGIRKEEFNYARDQAAIIKREGLMAWKAEVKRRNIEKNQKKGPEAELVVRKETIDVTKMSFLGNH